MNSSSHNTPSARIRGRGATENPTGRFERISYVPDPEAQAADASPPTTTFFRDNSRTIIAYNDSPDVGFTASLNPYRGCEHGCVYCYARPTHEYFGLSAGIDFESKIIVKENAPELLRDELSSSTWTPQAVAISGVTDAYQPIERKLQLTRRCLEVLLEFRNPVGIVTKNHLVTRDLDIFREMARYNGISIAISVTTMDAQLANRMEPRASQPALRLKAIQEIAAAGVPVRVFVAPIIPGLNDHEIPAILRAAADAGATHAGYVMLRLPHGVKDLFAQWLTANYPDKRDKVLARIMAVRGGALNEAAFHKRMRGDGIFADMVKDIFAAACRKAGLNQAPEVSLSTAAFRVPGPYQPSLF